MLKISNIVFWISLLNVFLLSNCRQEFTQKIPDLPLQYDAEDQKRLSYLNELIKEDAGNPLNYYQRGYLHHQNGNISDALEDIRECIRLDDQRPEYFVLLGRCYFAVKSYRAALDAFKQAQRMGYRESDIYIDLGSCYLEQKVYDQSIQYLRDGLREYPQNAQIYYQLALAHYGKKDTIHTLALLDSSIALDPNFFEAYQKKAILQMFAHAYGDAVLTCRKAIQQMKEKQAAYTLLAGFYKQMGYRDSALANYQKAYATDSSQTEPAFRLAEMLVQQAKYKDAIPKLQQLMNRYGDAALVQYYLGISLHFQGFYKEAIPYYAQVPYGHEKYKYAQRFIEKLRYLSSDSLKSSVKPIDSDSL